MNGKKLKERFLESRKFLFAQFALNRFKLSQNVPKCNESIAAQPAGTRLHEDEIGLQKVFY